MTGHHTNAKPQPTISAVARFTARGVLALALAACGIAMFVFNPTIRTWEAWLASVTTGWVIPGYSGALGETVYYGLGGMSPRGLEITLLCSSVIIFGPILLLGALLVGMRRFSIVGALKGLIVALLIIVTANMARMGLIAFGWDHWGSVGFSATHLGFGSIFALLAFSAGLVVFLKLALVKKRRAHA